MIDALRYEVVRLRTLRSTWWLLGTCLVVSFGVALLFAGLSVSHGYEGNLVPALTALAGQFIVPIIALLTGLVGAFAIGHEHRYGTIRLTLAVLPRRTEVLLAKVLVVGLWSVVVSALSLLVAWVAMLVWPGARILADPVSHSTLTRVCVGFVLLALLYALLGMALAGLLRNLPGAIVLLVVWPLLVERILTALTLIPGLSSLRDDTKYLPFSAGQQLVAVPVAAAASAGGGGGGPGGGGGQPVFPVVGPWEGGAILGGLTLVLLVAWWVAFQRSDA